MINTLKRPELKLNSTQCDAKQKQITAAFLESIGFEDVQETNERVCYDLFGYKDDQLWRFEIKARTFPSTKYGDTTIEKCKYDLLSKFDNVYVISVFTDDKISLVPLEAPHTEFTRVAAYTTYWANKTPVKKTFVSYKNTLETLYDFPTNN